MTKTSRLPSYSPVNAICDPSGENFGKYSVPGCVVNRLAIPPAAGATHRSASAENTTRSPWRSG